MTNRLKAYVRRTILGAAKGYAYPKQRRTGDSTRAACLDAMNGTDTGWWTDLIYTAPMLDMARKYRADIATALSEYREATGESFVYRERNGHEPEATAEEILSALVRRKPLTWKDYSTETHLTECNAALTGLRFAVEWYAGEVARELAPEL